MKKLLALLTVLVLTMSLVSIASAETIELEVWSPLSGSKAEAFEKLVNTFNESQTDVHVTHVSQGSYSVLSQKMAGAFNAGNMPAMLICDYIDVPMYAQRGMLVPMTEVLSEDVIADFFPGMLVDLTVDGTLYAVPYNRTTQGFIVNNDLLKQAGIDRVASTWDEYYEDAKKFKDAMGDGYYYGFAFFNQYIYDAIAASFGVEMMDGETVNLATDNMKEMFSYFRKMYEEDLLVMVPTLSGSFAEQFSPFLEGTVATVFQSSSFVSSARTMLDCDWSFEYMPSGKAGYAVTIGGTNMAVSATATEAERTAAKTFLEFMTSPESSAEVFTTACQLPVRKSTLELDSVKTFCAENAWTTNLIAQIDNAVNANPITKNVGDIYNLANDMIVRIIYNGEDMDEVFAEFNETFQEYIDTAIDNDEFAK